MPSRNVIKVYVPNTYYHVYNRGVDKRRIFRNQADYGAFLNLFKRYLSGEPQASFDGHYYEDLSSEIELLAYCLMPTHIHLLVYQYKARAVSRLLQRIMTSYTMYFNKKDAGRVGGLYQGRYKASMITTDSYLWHISRYIHLNPLDIGEEPETYQYSSYQNYVGGQRSKWLKPQRILDLHTEHKQSYPAFVNDYKDYKKSLDEIKYELAQTT